MLRYLLVILLAGCAAAVPIHNAPPGVHMSADEKAACERYGCSVWTEEELKHLIAVAMARGKESCSFKEGI